MRNPLSAFRPARSGRARAAALLALLILVGLASWLGTGRAPDGGIVTSSGTADGPVPAGRYVLQGRIVDVADGDTVTLQAAGARHRIRLDSIDAPESGHGPQQPGQPFAQAARRQLSALVAGKTLQAQCYEKDQYGRDVCALMLPGGSSANRELVASGHAWAYTARRGAYLNDGAMRGLQARAERAGLGLWAQSGARAPWQWRYDCWKQQQCH
ncbi:thermonuclease family protein [Bordetella trematum]|uniref:thermonuclease family protein n=1 Tax=Bordetella trematum TaxID=123899 RepID=UPI00398979DD